MYRRPSADSSQRPLSDPDYARPDSTTADKESYGAGYRNPTAAAAATRRSPNKRNPWLWYGLPVLIVAVIAGAVVGGVVGSRNSDKHSSSGSGSDNGSPISGSGGDNGVGSGNQNNFVPTGYDNNGNPVYATSTNAAAMSAPTAGGSSPSANLSCPVVSLPDGFQSSGSGESLTVRPDHPRLFADQARWDCVSKNIRADSYLSHWNETVMNNATRFAAQPPTNYSIDGGYSGSGVLDVAREVQLRMKHWAYAWRMTKDPKWGDRAWTELQVASGNTSTFFGREGNNWNNNHFLDVGEFTLAFAYAFDWMYDYWNDQQRDAIMYSILTLGIGQQLNATSGEQDWWSKVNGNWNCVTQGGITAGALAILDRDPTGQAARVLGHTIPSATENCVMGIQEDGTWSETANYWYFGNSALVQMASALETSTGSVQEMFDHNPSANMSGLFHMYVSGNDGMFNYGDTGPNKYTATANALIYYGRYFKQPMYTLYQRDRQDATEPLAMLWYDATVSGAWWNNLPLDHNFDGPIDAWASMRSSWTDTDGLYAAMKSGNMTGHQTHGDIDAGDFVIDAMGTRWAGELNSANYLSDGYFSSEAQNSQRWLYYRKRTEGQNTLLLNSENQNVDAQNPTTFGTTGESQKDLATPVDATSTAWWWTDLSAAYNGTNIKRGMRLLNGRKQVLIQDEIQGTQAPIQWRMHTNATVTLSDDKKTATLDLDGKTTKVIIQGQDGTFGTTDPVRLQSDPPLPNDPQSQDQENPDVTVLTIDLQPGSYTLEVLFNPQWDGMSASDFITPKSVALAQWSNDSHN